MLLLFESRNELVLFCGAEEEAEGEEEEEYENQASDLMNSVNSLFTLFTLLLFSSLLISSYESMPENLTILADDGCELLL